MGPNGYVANKVSTMADRGITVEKLYLQRCGISGDGMHLELCIAKADGRLDEAAQPHPLATIRADSGDERKFEFYTNQGTVSVPLEQIEKAIEMAKQVVHSEDYYDSAPE